MNFLWPQALLLLVAAPLLAAAIYLRPSPRRIPGLEMPNASRWQRHLPPALYLGALVIAVLATARPTALITLPSQQRTIIMAIDVSLSMRVTDVKPNRMAAAQEAAKTFLHDLPKNIEVGLVTFAGSAQVVQRATMDRAALVDAGGRNRDAVLADRAPAERDIALRRLDQAAVRDRTAGRAIADQPAHLVAARRRIGILVGGIALANDKIVARRE